MKKQIRHIAFLLLSASLLVSATVLTLDGWSSDFDFADLDVKTDLSLEEKVEPHVLDTAQFFIDNTCYEYCELEEAGNNLEISDQLSKTVVKVENLEGEFEDIENSSVRRLPPNASLNLMIEKYTVKREVKDTKSSFYVTVESFNTTIERVNLFDFNLNTKNELGASLNNEQLNLIRKFWSQNNLAKKCLEIDTSI